MPDKGKIVFDEGVGRIDGWALCHFRFALVVVSRDEGGRHFVSVGVLTPC